MCGSCACVPSVCRDTAGESREGDGFQFYSTNANGRVPSGNFESNWLSGYRLCKQKERDER